MSIEYVTDSNNLRTTLEQYGVAIIHNVIDDDECEQMKSEMWDFFEHITQYWSTPIYRDVPRTWKKIYELMPLHSQLFQHWSVGHCQASWTLRQKEKIVDIFAKFWNTNELLTSFDGLSMSVPPEVTNKGWHIDRHLWLHCDQSFTRSGFECMQSWITANDIGNDDGSLMFLEGSHKYHEEFGKEFDIKNKNDWYKLSPEEVNWYKVKGCELKKITCPKGSMVFWDSRTIHSGCNPNRGREIPRLRQVIYLCYMPKVLCDQMTLLKKQKYFETLRTCNHWPCKPKPFPIRPRTYGKDIENIVPINQPILTDLGMYLAGF